MTADQLYVAARIAFGWRFTAAPLFRCMFIGATLRDAVGNFRRAHARHALN